MDDGVDQPSVIEDLARRIRACRICRDNPVGPPLPHEPRPIFRISATATLCIASQAPGMRAHLSGKPFSDPSGVRLRAWMGVTEDEFYDESRVAITPMGFCFPGYDAKGGDIPPRKECAKAWRAPLFAALPQFRIILVIGVHAQKWHLSADACKTGMTATIRNWRECSTATAGAITFPLPHPSWRNNGWLRRNPWFENELVPKIQYVIRQALSA